MYRVNDYVFYGSSGVCKVLEVGVPSLSALRTDREYYTLMPVYGTEKIYTPVDCAHAIRPILTKKEAEELISHMPQIKEAEIDTKSIQMLTEHYNSFLRNFDVESLVVIIKTAHGRTERAKEMGKNPGKVDERFRKRAEELLYGELAVALDIPIKEVLPYIHRTLGN